MVSSSKDQENGAVGVGNHRGKGLGALELLNEVHGGWNRAGSGPRGGQKGGKAWCSVPCGRGCRSVLRAVGSPKGCRRAT